MINDQLLNLRHHWLVTTVRSNDWRPPVGWEMIGAGGGCTQVQAGAALGGIGRQRQLAAQARVEDLQLDGVHAAGLRAA